MPRLILAGSAALLLAGCAAEAEDISAPIERAPQAVELAVDRVVDTADILASPFEARVADQLEELEDRTGVQLVIATTPSLNGRTIEAYSLDLANGWGIGSADRNDGLLLLVAPNDGKTRIEVGLGLEKAVTNEEAAMIIQQMLPHFSSGDYEAGIAVGLDGLIREVTPIETKEAA